MNTRETKIELHVNTAFPESCVILQVSSLKKSASISSPFKVNLYFLPFLHTLSDQVASR